MENLQFALVDYWSGIDQANPKIQFLDDLVSWKSIPTFHQPGRTGWLSLEVPIFVSKPSIFSEINGVKLKGIGLCNKNGNITQPTTQPYYRANPHLGFDPNGTFVLVPSAPAPLGGITFHRAQSEFEIARTLVEHQCPSVIPIRLYQYLNTDRVFQANGVEPSPLGVVITGLSQSTPFRADCAFQYGITDPQTQQFLDTLLDQMEIRRSTNPGLSLVSKLGHLYGRTLRKFNELGFYRYSGTLDNYAYCHLIQEVFLIDLDSSRRLDECSEIERPLQIMRDVASSLFNLAAGLMNPKWIQRFPATDIRKFAPFQSVLLGYYHEAPPRLIDSLSYIFQEYYLKMHQRVFNNLSKILSGKTPSEQTKIFQRYWMDRKETYSFLMAILWFLHKESNLIEFAPHELSIDDLYHRIAAFSSPDTANTLARTLESLQRT